MRTYSEDELFQKATHVKCMVCNQVTKLDIVLLDADDIDMLYDDPEYICCEDPSLIALICSDKPFFDEPQLDAYYYAEKGRVSMFGEKRTHNYVIEVDDDLFEQIEEAQERT